MIALWVTEMREWIATTLVPVAVVLIPLMLLRQNKKTKQMREENATDHGFVQERLGQLTGAVEVVGTNQVRTDGKVDHLAEKLSEHIGSHNPLPAVVVQVPVHSNTGE